MTTFDEAAYGLAWMVKHTFDEATFANLLSNHPTTMTILAYAGAGIIDVPDIPESQSLRNRCVKFYDWLISDPEDEDDSTA